MKTLRIALVTLATALAALYACADTISGRIKIDTSDVTHTSSSTASMLTEYLPDAFLWAGTTDRIGDTGTVSYISRLLVSAGTIVANGTNTIDLYGGLLDSFAQTANFVRVKGFIFVPTNSVAAAQIIRPASASGFTNWTESTSGVSVRSGGAFAMFAPDATGFPVSNGVCDTVEIVNTGTNAGGYRVYWFGE